MLPNGTGDLIGRFIEFRIRDVLKSRLDRNMIGIKCCLSFEALGDGRFDVVSRKFDKAAFGLHNTPQYPPSFHRNYSLSLANAPLAFDSQYGIDITL